ncbi:VanW family protein [Tindallia californiensis]|uniref:Vancomycin resistance protein YoaR, contains peptidoglycan-binding and VanW domains n=1 Tax=Tindallia californiensis TaxID=159292 RepID=A0A1H3MP22_9FIRM|nr:VanW family protein [Tindallia californiensis]SDY78411.1 Vancomycin resistance protein YoaR, contains peptidoglycan-binding and VanW domains [Tindallia californiensis]
MKPNHTSIRIRSAFGLLLVFSLQVILASLLSFPPYKNELPTGTKVNGKSASGLTGQQVILMLNEALPEVIEVEFIVEGKTWRMIEIPMEEIEAGYDQKEILEDIQRLLNPHWKDRWIQQLSGGIRSSVITYPIKYNEELLEEWSDDLERKLLVESIDADLKVIDGEVIISAHRKGYQVKSSDVKEKMKESLHHKDFDDVQVAVHILNPEVTTESLGNFDQLLAIYETSLGSNQKRNTNIKLGAEKINGLRLEPEEVFSFNETVGKVSAEDGYQPAPVIQNGRLVQGLGGGICQVSSTLYQATLYSGMEIVERRNHSLPVGYVPLGMDATIAYGIQDFSFRNPHSFPVVMGAWVAKEELHIAIWGDRDYEKENIRIETRNRQVISPSVNVIKDPLLEKGVEVVRQKGQNGYRISVYRITGDRENNMKEELISRDYYRPVARTVLVGTGEDLEERKSE